MLLLSDGTVMAKSFAGGSDGYGTTWYKLTPSSTGSYVNGTWTTLTAMANTRLYFSSQVLKDGRVFVAGGEYGTGGSAGETYDPLANTWTAAPTQSQRISDANSEILPDGRVLVALVTGTLRSTVIFDPVANTWTSGPTSNGIHNESAWVKLPDGSSLMVDRLSTNSERYIPSLNQWVVDATVPVALYDSFGDETGPGFLLPDGRAFFIGAPSNTAYYTPSGNSNPGTWATGPTIPGGRGAPDAPGAMMPNGKILCALSPTPTSANHFPAPTTFWEFDYTANTFTQVNAPGGGTSLGGVSSYVNNMLALPDGTVLYSRQGQSQYYVYNPGGTPLAAGKPAISSITSNGDGSYHLTGTQLNGISQGASYGDDWQMNTNYPIVRLTSGTNVYYARTYNWSSTGVMTGSTQVTTEFTLPAGLSSGTYSLVAVANGIASDPYSFVKGGAVSVSVPATAIEGDPAATGTVTASPIPASNLVVSLTSSNTNKATVPASVTILAGQASATFAVTIVDNALLDGTQNATITATASGYASGTGVIAVADNDVHHFTVSTIPSPQVKGMPFGVSITAKDLNGVTIANYAGATSLTASGSGGAVAVFPPSLTGFAGGVWTGNVTANKIDTSVFLTVDAGAGHAGASNAFTVSFGALDHFAWNSIPSPEGIGTPFSATIAAMDAAGNIVGNFAGTATLTCGKPSRLIGAGTASSAVLPLAASAQEERTQCIYLQSEIGSATTLHALSFFVTAVPGATLGNFTIRMKHTALASFATAAWDASGWTTVFQADQTVSATGWVAFNFTTPFAYDGSSNLMIDVSFSNPSASTAGQCRYTTATASRTLSFASTSANGDPLTWSGTSPQGIASAQLPNIALQLDRTVPMTPAATGIFVNGVWTGTVQIQQYIAGGNLRADSGSVTGESNSFDVAYAAPTLSVTPAGDLITGGSVGGAFSPASATYALSNVSVASLNWTAGKTAAWITLSSTGGTLAPGASTTVTASINATANGLATGVFSDTVTFTNTTNAVGNTTRSVNLSVAPGAPVLPPMVTYTKGTGSSLSWTASPGATAYDVQISSTYDFASPSSTQSFAGPSAAFTGLTNGAIYFYRAKASAPSGSSTWSNIVASYQDATPPAIAITNFSQGVPYSTTHASVLVQGTASDTPSGLYIVQTNGQAATTSDGFAHWSGTVPLAAGANTVTATAFDNAQPGGNSASASISITQFASTQSDGLPDSWKTAHGLDPNSTDPANGPLGDPAQDGFANLLKYAFNLDPQSPATAPYQAFIQINPADGLSYLMLSYPRRIGALDLRYTVEISDDLTWLSPTGTIEQISVAANANGITETVIVRIRPEIGAATRKFVRVRVTAL